MAVTARNDDLVVEFLESPAAYAERPSHVDIKETHISRVYLTQKFAYKQKKPVRFDFLDFSTLKRRQEACEAELHLNRRLAANVYLAVVPVCQTKEGKLSIAGEGEPIDWLVKMRRLDDAKTLESLIRTKQLNERQIADLANMLARFYILQAPSMVKSHEYFRSLSTHIEANRQELIRIVPEYKDLITFGYALQIRYLNLFHDVFNERVCDGRIIGGHGDLRPDHVYFEAEPIVIDCIEFNAEYRQNDIVDDIAFLAMECDRLGRDDIGRQIFDAYFSTSHDRACESLVAFYKCYRAFVRAKVAALRNEQLVDSLTKTTANDVESYLQLAKRYAESLGPSLVITVGGMMGTGKSTLAECLADQLGGTVLSTDVVRNEIFDRDDKLGFGEGKYASSSRRRVYTALFQRLEDALKTTSTVLLDGTFGNSSIRKAARAEASKVGAQCLHIKCECPKEVAIQRIMERGPSMSETRPEFYKLQLREQDSYQPHESVIEIDTTRTPRRQLEIVFSKIRELIVRNELQLSPN